MGVREKERQAGRRRTSRHKTAVRNRQRIRLGKKKGRAEMGEGVRGGKEGNLGARVRGNSRDLRVNKERRRWDLVQAEEEELEEEEKELGKGVGKDEDKDLEEVLEDAQVEVELEEGELGRKNVGRSVANGWMVRR